MQIQAQYRQFIPAVALLLLCSVAVASAAGDVKYKLVNETIYDKPIKTQIEQHFVASGVPTERELRAAILERYEAAKNRRGFRYHDAATNIYIYVYGSQEQALAGQGLWIGMIAKGHSDPHAREATINEERLAALSLPAAERFGLSEDQRMDVYRQIIDAEDQATKEAMRRVPDSEIMRQITLERELLKTYKSEVAQKYGLTDDQLRQIGLEAYKKGWAH